MNEIEILTEINKVKVENIMKHIQFADTMDFMAFKGFKREGEYYYLKENIELRKLRRFSINHLSLMIYDTQTEKPNIQPISWQGHKREEVDNNTRKKYVRSLFIEWEKWETDTCYLLQSLYRDMCKLDLFYADYILCMIKDVEMEKKYLERQILEYESVDWDLCYLMELQDELHEKYKCLSNKLEI